MVFGDGDFPGGNNSNQNRDNAQRAKAWGQAMERLAYDFLNGNPINPGSGGSHNAFGSQSAVSDRVKGNRGDTFIPQRQQQQQKQVRGGLDGFEDGIKEEFLKSIVGDDLAGGVKSAMAEFTNQFGVSLHDLPNAVGKEMMRNLMQTNLGESVSGGIKNFLNKGLDKLGGSGELGKSLSEVGQSFLSGAGGGAEAAASGMEAAAGAATSAAGDLAAVGATGAEAAAGAATAGEAMAAAAPAVTAIASALPPILIAMAAILVVMELAGPAIEGFVDVLKTMGAAALRNDSERAKRLENAQARLKKDIEAMVEEPFNILTEAANKWYDTWDSNLKTISQTQGYNKEDVYNLYSSYAERLKSEGLGSVISSTDIVSKLTEVLNTGLSGKVAEEFAYTASKLNAAIPTEDFFGYASTYAQVAANAIAQGESQEVAIQRANQQLETFASNLLYSSRELAGGFSTGLKNASSLFESSVKIAQSAKTGDAANISGTLTSVSAIVGAIAPDLAGGLVDNIIKAAVGGNSETIVALRSLAGINASNTEFLKALAEDPKSVFTNLFNKLAELQNMSNDNFMEVAEGLSSVFGVDMAAFAQVDFNYLADAISQMQVNQNSLSDNLELLAEGQSTTTAEQAKMQQINEMILNDGLAVVLDNQAARTIQENMWAEERANAIMSATYAVDMQGAALKFIEGIAQTVTNIIRFLNPIGALAEMVENIAETVNDSAEQQASLSAILERGAIKTNTAALANLRDYSGSGQINSFGPELANINTRLSDMLFGSHTPQSASGRMLSAAANVAGAVDAIYSLAYTTSNVSDAIDVVTGAISNFSTTAGLSNSTYSDVKSQYSWGTVSKSLSRAAAARAAQGTTYSDAVIGEVSETEPLVAKLKAFMQTASEFNQFELKTAKNDAGEWESSVAGDKMSYEDWVKTAFSDLDEYAEAIAAYGTTEEQIRGLFESNQAASQAAISEERANAEGAFYADAKEALSQMRKFWDYDAGTSGVYETVIWNPFVTALSNFWNYSGGSFMTQYWNPFYGNGQKFDTRMTDIYNEMVNERDNWIGAPSDTGTVRGLLNTIDEHLVSFNNSFDSWVQEWTDYYIHHIQYTQAISAADWSQMRNMEAAQSQDAVLAMAQALDTLTDLQGQDPTVQSNVLLAKIVVLLETIMQQNNSTGGLSLIDSLSAMSLGLTNRTS